MDVRVSVGDGLGYWGFCEGGLGGSWDFFLLQILLILWELFPKLMHFKIHTYPKPILLFLPNGPIFILELDRTQ